jgi:hypothetical protein
MRSFRLVLVAALGLGASAAAASAAPPVGCYGLPDTPEAFVCVTSFTPQNALYPWSPVVVPRVCAGDCYGPVTYPLPNNGSDGSGRVAVVTYRGQTYVVSNDVDVPPVPGLPRVPPEVSDLLQAIVEGVRECEVRPRPAC